jgi:PAS domain S-box-containing protein
VNDYRSSPYAHPVTLQHTQLTASLGAPLCYREELIGAITLSHEGGRTFTPPDEDLLQLFATHAAIAIENARLYDTAQRELRQREAAEAELRRIVRAVEQSASIVVITDAAGGIEYVNPKFTEVTGYTAAEVRGRNPRILKSGHTPAEGYAHLWATLAAGREWRGEFRNRRKDGTLYWEAASISPVRDAAGIVTHYVGVKEDITARKAADAALRRYASHLEALRATTADITRELDLATLLGLVIERAVSLLDGVSGAIYLCDPTTEDITPQAWVGHGDWLAAIRLRPGEGIAGTVIQQRHGLVENAYRTSPYVVAPFLDRTNHTAVLAEPLCYRDRVIGAVLVDRRECGFTDSDRDLLRLCADQAAIAIENARLFTTTQAALHTLRQAQEELVRTEKLRGLGQMAAGIAHDLNNTLATILGQAELLRLRAQQPEVQDGLQTLLTAASDGAAVVRRIQDFARQRGSGPLSACDLRALVPEALKITRPRWREEPRRHGIVIEAVTEVTDLPFIQGNPAEIREALTNLIFNAVDAMPQGGCLRVTGRVRDGQDDEGPAWWPDVPVSQGSPPGASGPRWVELAVSDTGVGMTDEVRQRAFDPFFTTKGLHGTGLGLSVVYGIMERHGGRVQVTSTPGRGTTIVLQFRLASPDPEPPAPPAPSAVVPRRRILLVDDDPAVRHTLATLLRVSGQDVIEAESGAAGLRCLETTPVDLVVTDLGMPDVTGWEVARAAKARRPDLPVVLLTGWGDQVEGEAPALVRVDRVLTKPVPRRAMLAVIAELTTRL